MNSATSGLVQLPSADDDGERQDERPQPDQHQEPGGERQPGARLASDAPTEGRPRGTLALLLTLHGPESTGARVARDGAAAGSTGRGARNQGSSDPGPGAPVVVPWRHEPSPSAGPTFLVAGTIWRIVHGAWSVAQLSALASTWRVRAESPSRAAALGERRLPRDRGRRAGHRSRELPRRVTPGGLGRSRAVLRAAPAAPSRQGGDPRPRGRQRDGHRRRGHRDGERFAMDRRHTLSNATNEVAAHRGPPWTSERSSNAQGGAIMTPLPSSSIRRLRGWTRRPALFSGTRSSRATRSRRR